MRISTHRLLGAALALLGTGAVSAVMADPPAAPAATPASAATTAAPAASAPNAAAPAAAKPTTNADAAQAAEEKRLLAAGYKPEMRSGVKMWCRSEQELGSNLHGHKVCASADEIKSYAHDSQDSIEAAQRSQRISPAGH